MNIPLELLDRIEVSKCGCWNWTGWTNKKRGGIGRHAPYGVFQRNRKVVTAHRYFYEIANGIVLDNTVHVHHKCKNTLCVNPDHLERITIEDHSRLHNSLGPTNEIIKTRKTCANGHEWTEETTYVCPKGIRGCKICRLDALRRFQAKGKRIWKPRTHCKKGHPFSGDNLYVNPQGRRFCRQCNRERHHFKLPIT